MFDQSPIMSNKIHDHSHGCPLDSGCKSFLIINASRLLKPSHNKPCLEFFESFISYQCCFVNPFWRNQHLSCWSIYDLQVWFCCIDYKSWFIASLYPKWLIVSTYEFGSCILPIHTKSLNNVTRSVSTQLDLQNKTCFLIFRRFSIIIGSFATNWFIASLSGAMFSYCHVGSWPCKTSCNDTLSPFFKSFISLHGIHMVAQCVHSFPFHLEYC